MSSLKATLFLYYRWFHRVTWTVWNVKHEQNTIYIGRFSDIKASACLHEERLGAINQRFSTLFLKCATSALADELKNPFCWFCHRFCQMLDIAQWVDICWMKSLAMWVILGLFLPWSLIKMSIKVNQNVRMWQIMHVMIYTFQHRVSKVNCSSSYLNYKQCKHDNYHHEASLSEQNLEHKIVNYWIQYNLIMQLQFSIKPSV